MSEKELSKIFSVNLKKILSAKNMSQIELANKVNVSKSTVSSWISGVSMPRMSKLNDICKVLDIDISLLVEDSKTYLAMTSNDYRERKDFFNIDKLKKALELNIDFSADFIGWAFDNENFSKDELLEILNYANFVKNRRK